MQCHNLTQQENDDKYIEKACVLNHPSQWPYLSPTAHMFHCGDRPDWGERAPTCEPNRTSAGRIPRLCGWKMWDTHKVLQSHMKWDTVLILSYYTADINEVLWHDVYSWNWWHHASDIKAALYWKKQACNFPCNVSCNILNIFDISEVKCINLAHFENKEATFIRNCVLLETIES